MSGLLGGGGAAQNKPIIYSGLNVSSSRRDLPVAIFWGQRRLATNAIWYNDFKKNPVSGGKGGGKGGGGKGGQQYDYTAATIVALCEGPVDSIVRIFASGSTTTTSTLSQLNQEFFSGTALQSPWSFAATEYASQARAYALTAYLASPKTDLGSSATIPDNAYECIRLAGFAYSYTTPRGWIDPNSHHQYTGVDVLITDVINDLLTSQQYGMSFAASDIGDRTQLATYLRAQGIFLSPLLNDQTKCTDKIDTWAGITNSWIYWSGTQLQFVPLGDSVITGHGVTYTPHDEIAYDLSTLNGDFLAAVGTPPIKVQRLDPADCPNRCSIAITDRALGYVSNPIEYKDQTLCDDYGQKNSSDIQADDICDAAVGAIVAALIGKRGAYIRNTYAFKTSFRYIRCLPGTVVTLTNPNLKMNKVRVRVRTIDEDTNGDLSFTAEEFPSSVGTPIAITTGNSGAASVPNKNVTPGSVNTPCIVEPDAKYTGGVPQIILAASGGPDWGGCTVHLSFDNGVTYSPVGKIAQRAIQGALTDSLASHTDPDTADTLAVDCTQSLAIPTAVTNADADALRTISWVAAQPTLAGGIYTMPSTGEMLAFGAIATTAAYAANLTYLRRGQYGFPPAAHANGDQFTLLNVLGNSGSTIEYRLPVQYIGQAIYVKFTSFNVFGNSEESPSDVATFKYTPSGLGYGGGGAGLPHTPGSFAVVNATSGANKASWVPNAVADNVTSYGLYRATGAGSSFGSATLIWNGLATSYSDTAITAGVTYVYFLVAVNAVGPSSTPATSGSVLTTSVPVSGGTSGGAITVTPAADGTTTAFTLSSGTSGFEVPIVTVGGLYKVNGSDYTISGATLTFTTAPAAGAAITVAYTAINYGYLI